MIIKTPILYRTTPMHALGKAVTIICRLRTSTIAMNQMILYNCMNFQTMTSSVQFMLVRINYPSSDPSRMLRFDAALVVNLNAAASAVMNWQQLFLKLVLYLYFAEIVRRLDCETTLRINSSQN